MPRSYRRIFVAVVGGLIALHAEHQAVAQQPASHQTQARDSASGAPVRKLPGANKYQPRCDQPKDREESDLCAQWGAVFAGRQANVLAAEANRAARDANTVSAETLWWTQAGFFAVVISLIASAFAAWAAAKAAKSANESVHMFQAAEAGILVPKIDWPAQDVLHVKAVNRGRTLVSVFHADLCIFRAKPTGPLPVIMTGGQFKADVGIAAEKAYDFEPQSIRGQPDVFYLAGGVLYRNMFGGVEVARISAKIDRVNVTSEVFHGADFSKWDKLADRMKRGKSIKNLKL